MKTSARKLALSLLLIAILLTLIGIVLTSRYEVVQVRGESMYPTFKSGDRIVLRETPAGEVGEYVLFTLPEGWKERWLGDDDTTLIKRIALAPGDELEWDGRAWYRNGEEFSSLSSGTCQVEPMRYVLSKGEYFVTGDTVTTQTMDSREGFCFDLGFLVTDDEVKTFGRLAGKF